MCEWQRLLVTAALRQICLDLGGDRGLARGGWRWAGRVTVGLVTRRRLAATNTRALFINSRQQTGWPAEINFTNTRADTSRIKPLH